MSNNPFSLSPIDRVANELDAKTQKVINAPIAVERQTGSRKSTDGNSLLPPENLKSLFDEAAVKYDVPVDVLLALGHQESSYKSEAVGVETKYGTAKGLMQYIDSTASSLGIDPFNPVEAIEAAAMQMRNRLDNGYSMEEAVMAHHGGDNRSMWGEKTRSYSNSVLNKAEQLSGIYEPSFGGAQMQEEPQQDAQPQPQEPSQAKEANVPAFAADDLAKVYQTDPIDDGSGSVMQPYKLARNADKGDIQTTANRFDNKDSLAARVGLTGVGLEKSDAVAVSGQLRESALNPTEHADLIDPSANARARRLMRDGLNAKQATGEANLHAARGTPIGEEVGAAKPSTFDFDAQEKFNNHKLFSNPVIRGAVKGYEGYKQGILGVWQAAADAVGADGLGNAMREGGDESRNFTSAMGEGHDYAQQQFEGVITSISQQMPALIAGAVTGTEAIVLGSMFVQSFGQEYGAGRQNGQDGQQASLRATQFALFEIWGERFGLGKQLSAFKRAAKGDFIGATDQFLKALPEELLGEIQTTTGQFLTDKEGGGVGLNVSAGWNDYLKAIGDTVVQTIGQTALMGGGARAIAKLREGKPLEGAQEDVPLSQENVPLSQENVPLSQERESVAAQESDPVVAANEAMKEKPLQAALNGVTKGGRVTATTPIGEVSGVLVDMSEEGVRMIGDDGQPYVFTQYDDVEVAPEKGVILGALDAVAKEEAAQEIPQDVVVDETAANHVEISAPEQILTETVNLDAESGVLDQPEQAVVEPATNEYAHKWFGSAEKAEKFIGKKKIGETHEVVKTGKVRFEIKLRGESENAPRGKVGQKFSGGDILKTASGRTTTAFPNVDDSTANSERRVNAWTRSNAIDEANARGDKDNAQKFASVDAKNLSPVDKDAMEAYLFEDTKDAGISQDAPKEEQEIVEKKVRNSNVEKMRATAKKNNPFMAFLAQHGVSNALKADAGVDSVARPIVSGFGSIFRKNGLEVDELAMLAKEAGFLTDADFNSAYDVGAANKLLEMIGDAVNGEKVGLVKDESDTYQQMAEARAVQELMDEAEALNIDVVGKSVDEIYDLVSAAHEFEESGFSTDELASIEEFAKLQNDAITLDDIIQIAHARQIEIAQYTTDSHNLRPEVLNDAKRATNEQAAAAESATRGTGEVARAPETASNESAKEETGDATAAEVGVRGVVAQSNEEGVAPAGSFEHKGYKITKTKIGGEELWEVQTHENAEKEKKGERQIGGNALLPTREGAIAEADAQAAKAAQDAEREAESEKKQQSTDVDTDADDYNGFLSTLTPNNRALAKKALGKLIRFADDGVMSIKDRVEKLHAEGRLDIEVTEENKLKDKSSREWHRMSNEQQREFTKKQQQAGTKKVYTVNDSLLGKTAYDYAEHLNGLAQDEGFELAQQTPEDARQQAEAAAEIEKRKEEEAKAAEQKKRADDEVETFALTGSDRPADAAGQADIFAAQPVEKEEEGDLSTPEAKLKVSRALADYFFSGKGFGGITEARKWITEQIGAPIVAGTPIAKHADETIEAGVVIAAREIVRAGREHGRTDSEIYDSLTSLYESQPNLSVRTSESAIEQAYSTPAPISFVASRLAGVSEDSIVYEPSAGNAMLVIEVAEESAILNELNEDRAGMLRQLMPDANITKHDAAKWAPSIKYDTVLMNPPFGAVKDADGNTTYFDVNAHYQTREIDHAIVFKALEALPENGRAVMIIGGVKERDTESRRKAYRAKSKREFFVNLYNNYNVVEHLALDGKMYSKQGANFPIEMIVINGRGQSQRVLPAAELPRNIGGYAELKEVLNENQNGGVASGRSISNASRGDGSNGTEGADANGGGLAGSAGESRAENDRSGERHQGSVETRGAVDGMGEPTESARRSTSMGDAQRQSTHNDKREDGKRSVSTGNNEGQSHSKGSDRRDGHLDVAGNGSSGNAAKLKNQEVETEFQVAYSPQSESTAVGTLVPVNMRDAIDGALDELTSQEGNLDAYVASKLEMPVADIFQYFSAEQVDALALAISNAENGKGFIIGDQTGVGKGRVVAAMIHYANVNGKTPIFITEKANLFADMIRDIDDIGLSQSYGLEGDSPRILQTNKDRTPYVLHRTVDGERVEIDKMLRQVKGGDSAMKKMLEEGGIGDYKAIFTTYSQLQPSGKTVPVRQALIGYIAGNNGFLICDESHNAGGAAGGTAGKQTRASYVRSLVNNVDGAMFSSATYAKRPDVMDLYSNTNMRLAVDTLADLSEAIQRGGVPMQQAVASMLANDGQYIRRERTFDGVTYDNKPVEVNKETAENIAKSLRRVLEFSRAKAVAVEAIRDKFDRTGDTVRERGEKTTVQSSNFGSIMHNLISQMLLSLKAQGAVDHALERLAEGEKVVITVANTMGSFIAEEVGARGLKNGDAIDLTFKDMFLRYLDKQRDVTITPPAPAKPCIHYLTDAELGESLTALYEEVYAEIEAAGYDSAPISPIDYMHSQLRRAGYKTDEITGRTNILNYGDGDIPVVGSRKSSPQQKLGAIRGFNDGGVDVIILNQSGSTGLSLHASEKFKDQRKRHMIIAQSELNIDTHMQMLGRVHRTGQVVVPTYTQLDANVPAEARPAATQAKKMASLNANTTASRESAVTSKTAIDFMNVYGGQVIHEYLRDNPDVYEMLGGDDIISLLDDTTSATEDCIRKVTGYIPILPIAMQEEIYKDIGERYSELLEREDSMGTNKLTARTLDLDAKVLSSETITEEKKEKSVFASPAVMEQIDVKRPVKPYSSAEVREMIAARLGEHNTREVAAQMNGDFTTKFTAFEHARIKELSETSDPIRVERERAQLSLMRRHVNTVLQTLMIGMSVSVTDSTKLVVHGIITDIQHTGKTKNPAAGSSWKMTIALADGESKALTVGFNQIGKRFTIKRQDTVSRLDTKTMRLNSMAMINAFDEGGVERREKRWMVTGNLLAGYARFQGQITNYTNNDGSTGQGVLMPRTFDYEAVKENASFSLNNSAHALAYMKEAGKGAEIGIAQRLSIKNDPDGGYRINVPRSARSGGQFFKDKNLTAAMGRGFVSVASRMTARIESDKRLAETIDYLTNSGVRLEALQSRDIAKRILGIGDPKYSVKNSDAGGVANEFQEIDTEQSREDIRILERAIEKDNNLPATRVKPFRAIAMPFDKVLGEIADAFGKRIVSFYVTPIRIHKEYDFFNGVALPEHVNAVYLNGRVNMPHMFVLGHEIVHQMGRQRPDLLAKLSDAIEPYVDFEQYSKMPNAESFSVQEEFLCDVVGDGFLNKDFWRALGNKNPQLLKRVINFVDGIIAKLFNRVPKTEKYLTDFTRVMELAGEVMAEYTNSPPPPPSPKDPKYAKKEEGDIVEEATSALNAVRKSPPRDFVGKMLGDLGLPAKFLLHPRQVASLHKEFAPVFLTAMSQMETRDATIAELGEHVADYNKLKDKTNVNKVLELGRLMGKNYWLKDLREGIEFTGTKETLVNGQKVNIPVEATLTKAGETIALSEEEIKSYQGVRKMLNLALDKFKDQSLIEMGLDELTGQTTTKRPLYIVENENDTFTLKGSIAGANAHIEENDTKVDIPVRLVIAQFNGKWSNKDKGYLFSKNDQQEIEALLEKELNKSVARQLADMAKLDPQNAERYVSIAEFVAEVEQAKRTGYVPFARYGNYYVAVKEVADLTFTDGGEDFLLVHGVPDSFAEEMAQKGAELIEDEGGNVWRIKKAMRQTILKSTAKTIYATKVETGISDKISEAKAEKVDDVKAVKAEIERIKKKYVGDNENRYIVTDEVKPKEMDGAVKLSDVDALAEIGNIDNATWDAVRSQLADAIKARGFRRHFFHSDNIAGYTGDFERAIADYTLGISGYLSRREHMRKWERDIANIKRKPRLHAYGVAYRDYVNNPQEEFAMLRQVGFFAYISGVTASACANLTQVPVMTLPTLGQVAPMPLVVKEVGRAYKDALAMLGRPSEVGIDMFDFNSAPMDVRAIMQEANDEGAFVPLEALDLMQVARQRNTGARVGVKMFSDITKVTTVAFTFAERLNRIVTFMAAARLARRRAVQANANARLKKNALAQQEILGKNWSEKAFAEWAVSESQYRMGKFNRPTVMRGVGTSIMQFKGFMMQSLEAWYRMMALHGRSGKYAAVASMMMLYAFGGTWGIPFADDLRALAEEGYTFLTDKDLDIKTEFRAWVAKVSGSNVLGQIASKGVTYPTGVDMTRIGLGTIVPESASRVAGIPFDMLIARPMRAAKKASIGDNYGAVAELSPNFIKHWLVAAGWAQDGLRDSRGNKIVLGEDISSADITMKLLGFMPTSITDLRDYKYAQRRQETSMDGLKRKYTSDMVRIYARLLKETDPERINELDAELNALRQEIDEHNEAAIKAGRREQIIQIKRGTIKRRIQNEFRGARGRFGKERKAARGQADSLRDLFLSED